MGNRARPTGACWRFWVGCISWGLLALHTGCAPSTSPPGEPELVWGRRGMSEGRLQKPRALAIDRDDCLYIVDMTARIQVFTADGKFLRGWSTPQSETGKPCGLSFDRQGNLLVADTHYYRVLVYTPQGKLLEDQTLGGQNGQGPGQFNFVTDCIQDAQGNYYVSEYGECDRIQKFSPERKFLLQWGSHGDQPGQFSRPQSLAMDAQGLIWVTDACNHRVQVFDASGTEAKLVRVWGRHGDQPGELSYPYGLQLDSQGNVYVSEFGNHRVQKFTPAGQSLGVWGTNGRRPGELYQPWSLVRDSLGRLHVLDTYNHRVQRIRL